MCVDDNKLLSYIIISVRCKKLIKKAVLTKENTLKKKILEENQMENSF